MSKLYEIWHPRKNSSRNPLKYCYGVCHKVSNWKKTFLWSQPTDRGVVSYILKKTMKEFLEEVMESFREKIHDIPSRNHIEGEINSPLSAYFFLFFLNFLHKIPPKFFCQVAPILLDFLLQFILRFFKEFLNSSEFFFFKTSS